MHTALGSDVLLDMLINSRCRVLQSSCANLWVVRKVKDIGLFPIPSNSLGQSRRILSQITPASGACLIYRSHLYNCYPMLKLAVLDNLQRIQFSSPIQVGLRIGASRAVKTASIAVCSSPSPTSRVSS